MLCPGAARPTLRKELTAITRPLLHLIAEQPMLWDTTLPEFYNHPKRIELWRDIARRLCSHYSSSNSKTKKFLVDKIRNRWRYVRTAYMRSQQQTGPKKPYIYDAEMAFYSAQSRRNCYDETRRFSGNRTNPASQSPQRRSSGKHDDDDDDVDDDQCFFDSLRPALRDLSASETISFQTNVSHILDGLTNV